MTDFLDDLARAIRALRADLAAAEARLAQSQTVSHGQAWDRITAEAENAALRARLAPIVALAERIADDAAKATKGPWAARATNCDGQTWWMIHSVAHDRDGWVRMIADEAGEPDARMIAVAPDMWAAILAAGGRA
jgi:hypothetical protein